MKQDIVIADRSATSRVTLWEEHVGALKQGKSYILKNFVVRVYQSTKYLGMGGDTTEIVLTDDIGEVHVASNIQIEEEVTLKNVVIVGVPHLDTHTACLQCKARVEPQHLHWDVVPNVNVRCCRYSIYALTIQQQN